MDVATLGSLRPLTLASLSGEPLLYRIQLPAPRPTSVVVGPVIVGPLGLMAYRFDLLAQPVGCGRCGAFDRLKGARHRRVPRRGALALVALWM